MSRKGDVRQIGSTGIALNFMYCGKNSEFINNIKPKLLETDDHPGKNLPPGKARSKAWMMSEKSSDHDKAVTWSLCDHHLGFDFVHSKSKVLPSANQSLDDV
jgi:hypothetical protein